jgi:hypothetical protein
MLRTALPRVKTPQKRVTKQFSETAAEKSVEISVESSRNLRRFAVAGRFAPTPVRTNKSFYISELPSCSEKRPRMPASGKERSFFFHMDKSL